MAELGFRPIEVNYLQALFDPISKEHYWNCTYIKKAGNGATEPRRIEPLPLIDRDGKEIQWNLLERFRSNLLPLPEKVDKKAWKALPQPNRSSGDVLFNLSTA